MFRRPTTEELRQMKRHPIETAIVLTIDLMVLPLYLSEIIIIKTITKIRKYGREQES